MSSRPILVTGGCGFIGSNFILDWIENNKSPVVNLDLLTYAGSEKNLSTLKSNNLYSFVHGDICDSNIVKQILQQYKPRAIVHMAAESHVDRSINCADEFVRTNILGTYNLLESARDYYNSLPNIEKQEFCLLYVSTDEVYGSLNLNDAAFTTESQYKPSSPYAATKASADHLASAWYTTYGLPIIISHCTNNYGPFQNEEKLIPLIIHHSLKGHELPIYGDGKNIRDWIYVQDHCHALNICLQSKRYGEIFNIGGNCEISNIELIKTVCLMLDELAVENLKTLRHPTTNRKLISYFDLITFVPDRLGHDKRYAINNQQIKQQLNWSPRTNIKEGLLKTIQWYLNNINHNHKRLAYTQ